MRYMLNFSTVAIGFIAWLPVNMHLFMFSCTSGHSRLSTTEVEPPKSAPPLHFAMRYYVVRKRMCDKILRLSYRPPLREYGDLMTPRMKSGLFWIKHIVWQTLHCRRTIVTNGFRHSRCDKCNWAAPLSNPFKKLLHVLLARFSSATLCIICCKGAMMVHCSWWWTVDFVFYSRFQEVKAPLLFIFEFFFLFICLF